MANQLARCLRRTMTRQEAVPWAHLRMPPANAHHFRRRVPLGPYIVDFACLRRHLVIELDGGGHGHAGRAHRDGERDAWLKAKGYRVLRVWDEVEENLSGVMDTILAMLGDRAVP